MIGIRRGSLAVAIGVVVAAGCSDSITEDPPAAGGSSGAGAAGGAGGAGGGSSACKPTNAACYAEGPEGPGSECLAVRNNVGKDNVQFRQTWSRNIAPKGNTIDVVYQVLKGRAQLRVPECNMPQGASGFMLLTDWDRSDPIKTNQTLRTGFANFVAVPDAPAARDNGLCMVDFSYDDAPWRLTLTPDQGMALPFAVKPNIAKRVEADFKVADVRAGMVPGDAIAYIDDTKGFIHGYANLGWIVVHDSATKLIAIPVHEFETTTNFNNGDFNCVGRFRHEAMDPNAGCDSASQTNPQWGCVNDACPAGEGPNYTKGYFLITELEQVYSTVLSSTLCISYPTVDQSVKDGWAKPETEPGGWGNNCRGSPKWNPADKVNGLPMGDWCSETNSAATPQCHDAYKSETFGAAQAFPVQAANCKPEGRT